MQYYLPTNRPGELPNLINNISFLRTSRPYESDSLLHADTHDHVLVLDGVLVG